MYSLFPAPPSLIDIPPSVPEPGPVYPLLPMEPPDHQGRHHHHPGHHAQRLDTSTDGPAGDAGTTTATSASESSSDSDVEENAPDENAVPEQIADSDLFAPVPTATLERLEIVLILLHVF